jgi:hypothetical protein
MRVRVGPFLGRRAAIADRRRGIVGASPKRGGGRFVAQLLDTMVSVRGQRSKLLERAFRRSPGGASIKDARLLSPRMRAPVVAAGSVGGWGPDPLAPRPACWLQGRESGPTRQRVTGSRSSKEWRHGVRAGKGGARIQRFFCVVSGPSPWPWMVTDGPACGTAKPLYYASLSADPVWIRRLFWCAGSGLCCCGSDLSLGSVLVRCRRDLIA